MSHHKKYPFRGGLYNISQISEMTGRKINSIKTKMGMNKGMTLDELYPNDSMKRGASQIKFIFEYPDGRIEEVFGIRSASEILGITEGTVSNKFSVNDSEEVHFGNIKVTRLNGTKLSLRCFDQDWMNSFTAEWNAVVESLKKYDLSNIVLVAQEEGK